jgi:hypothetical protein
LGHEGESWTQARRTWSHLSACFGGQGVRREAESEGYAEKYRAVVDGGYPKDEPVGQRWGKVEPALWGRRRSHSPTAPRCLRTARYGRTTRDLRMTGWWNYFGYANWRKEVTRLSGWIRRHMRKCFWLRWHNRAGRYNALRRLGVRGRGWNVAGCRRGAWPMATHVVVNQALKTATLNRFGFTLPWELAGA